MKKLAVIAFIVLVAGSGLYAALLAKTPVPQVTFVSLKGERITTESLRGKVVIVNFWATDCPICVREMPDMVKTYNRYHARGLDYVAVAMKYDPPNYVIHYVGRSALPFKVALDPMGKLAKAFGDVELTPTTFIIDKRGNIVKKIVGAPDFAKLHELLEAKLAEAA